MGCFFFPILLNLNLTAKLLSSGYYLYDQLNLKLRIELGNPFLEKLLIILCISLNCLTKRFTSCIDVPLPLAILLRRLPFKTLGVLLSSLVIELIIASTFTNALSSIG